VGSRFTVVRIPEEVEERDGALEQLELQHLVPGRECTVRERHEGSTRLTVHDDTDRDALLDEFVSARLLVSV
jgi:hypothetical protein